MQTFLPYTDFFETAEVLDKARLVKQRVETFQILNAITDPTYGWQNHPAVNQWRGYVSGLAWYGLAIHDECQLRGVKDDKRLGERIRDYLDLSDLILPVWIYDERVLVSHKSNLYRKDSEWYMMFEDIGPNVEYYWPSKDPKTEFYVPTAAEKKKM